MATLVRWEPFRELASLQSEMSRMLNGIAGAESRGAATEWAPALDVWETEDRARLRVRPPGDPRGRDQDRGHGRHAHALGGAPAGGRRSRRDRFYRFERRFGAFSRAVGLPPGVDESKIAAVSKDGVVEIHVPKPAEQKPRRIPLGSAPADLEASTPTSAVRRVRAHGPTPGFRRASARSLWSSHGYFPAAAQRADRVRVRRLAAVHRDRGPLRRGDPAAARRALLPQAVEERNHAMMMVQYLLDSGDE